MILWCLSGQPSQEQLEPVPYVPWDSDELVSMWLCGLIIVCTMLLMALYFCRDKR